MVAEIHTLTGLLEGERFVYDLTEGRHLIGRGDDCSLKLSESSVSRHHAEIDVCGDKMRIRDSGSSNGTHINGRHCEGWYPLRPRDRLVMGRINMTIDGEPEEIFPLLTIVGQPHTGGKEMSWRELQEESYRGDKRSELFGVLAQAGGLLTRPRSPDDLYEPILDLVETVADPSRALVVLLSDAGEPEIRASRLRGDAPERDVVLSGAVIERVIGERVSFLIEDALDDAQLRDRASVVRSSMRTAMAAPLFDNERVIGLLYADSTRPSCPYTTDELRAFTLLANVVAVALTHSRYRAVEREKHRLETEIEAARRIMNDLLSEDLPDITGYQLTAHLDPCSEVGGDLYDVIALDNGRFALVTGDVAGKGLGAALLVSSLLPLLRGLSGHLNDLPAVLSRIHTELLRITEPFRYATFFAAVLDPADGRIVYANAGHNPPLIVRGDGTLDTLGPTGPPVALLPESAWTAAEVCLELGDLLVLFSDGIPEAWNNDNQDYGDLRLQEVLADQAGRNASDVCTALLSDLGEFLDGTPASDDVTLMVLKREALRSPTSTERR